MNYLGWYLTRDDFTKNAHGCSIATLEAKLKLMSENYLDPNDAREKALDEVAFTAWQFAAAFEQLSFGEGIEPVRPPRFDEYEQARGLAEKYDISSKEIIDRASEFYKDTLEHIFPED